MVKSKSSKKLTKQTKMIKMILFLNMCVLAAVILSVAVSASASPKVGDVMGNVLYSDITAYINGQAIPTSVIQGQTLVVVENLDRYGFDVTWNSGARALKVELNTSKKFNPLSVVKDTANKPGSFKQYYYYTDIKTYISGVEVPSYAINGQTLMNFELLKKYGKLKWDAQAKTISLTIENNVIELMDITANGNYSFPTTQLTLTFDRAVPNLSASDITVTGATKGFLSGSGTIYYLSLTDIQVSSGQNITISLNKAGYLFTPSSKSVTVYKQPVMFSLSANGSDTSNTTYLTLIFDRAVAGLSPNDITVQGATKGTLAQTTANPNVYQLNISNIQVADRQYVSVQINKSGYEFSPSSASAQVRVLSPVTISSVVQENGSYSSSVTTQLRITLDRQIPGLNANDIIIDVPSGRSANAVVKGILSNTANNNQYILPITFNTASSIVPYPIKDGDVLTVRIGKTGYNFTPAEGRAVVVYNPDVITVNYTVYANGSTISPTTQLTIIFDRDMTNKITESNILVSPVSARGLLSGSGSVYYLPITPVAATSLSAVTVSINNANLPGYKFSPSSTSVTVYISSVIPVTGISGVPTTVVAGIPLTLTGIVSPSNATNKTIVWSVVNAGTTGASISGITLNTIAEGTAIVRATIVNGLTTGDFTQDYYINVTSNRSLSISLAFGSSNTIMIGGTTQLTAVKNPANMPVTWYIISGREYATIDQTGKVTAIANNTGSVAYVTVGVISNDGGTPQLSAEFIILISPIIKPIT